MWTGKLCIYITDIKTRTWRGLFWKCMPLVTWGEMENHESQCSPKYIRLCALLMTASSAWEAPTFSTVHICIMLRGKIYHLGGSQGFCLCYYIWVANEPSCFMTFSLCTSLSLLAPLCAQSSMCTMLTEPFPPHLLPLSSFPVHYRLTFKGIIPTHLQLLF